MSNSSHILLKPRNGKPSTYISSAKIENISLIYFFFRFNFIYMWVEVESSSAALNMEELYNDRSVDLPEKQTYRNDYNDYTEKDFLHHSTYTHTF